MLGWDPARMKISELFRQSTGASAVAQGDKPQDWGQLEVISFPVNAAEINSYDIQFYPAEKGAVTQWPQTEVLCSFAEADAP
jgi:hypothetical protein